MQDLDKAIALASKAIAIDTRSSKSNRRLADLLEGELSGFQVERIDFADPLGTEKSAIVAFRPGRGGPFLALSAHMDTVPPIGWQRDPFAATIEGGRLYGLGSCDMKGPLAVAVVTATGLDRDDPMMLLLTCDEETTKEGARRIVADSELLRRHVPAAIAVVEPTGLVPLRGHRVDIQFAAIAKGIQAHSSTAMGLNANINLIPFLCEMRDLYLQLRTDPGFQDPAYVPPWCDLNIIIDNHGTATNITPERASCLMKFRYSRAVDPAWVVERVTAAARRHNLALTVCPEGTPPELPVDHPLVRFATAISGADAEVGGFGSDASQFSVLSPSIVIGPGSMAQAHKPEEYVDIEQLRKALLIFHRLARGVSEGPERS